MKHLFLIASLLCTPALADEPPREPTACSTVIEQALALQRTFLADTLKIQFQLHTTLHELQKDQVATEKRQ
jgi:hypothetical protein